MHEITDKSKSPFDSIRQRDEQGNEFWYARQLMPVLGYRRWLRFVETINRAKVSCFNCDIPVDLNFADVGQILKIGDLGGKKEVTTDYKLSRYACYLVAMNGDPRKPEIAAAQNYFVVKTIEAESTDKRKKTKTVEQEVLKLTGYQLYWIRAAKHTSFLTIRERIALLKDFDPEIVNFVQTLDQDSFLEFWGTRFLHDTYASSLASRIELQQDLLGYRQDKKYRIGDEKEMELIDSYKSADARTKKYREYRFLHLKQASEI